LKLFPDKQIVLPILEANCRFRAPIRYGDQVTIVSTITEVNEKTLRVDHEVKVGDITCATGYELRAWVQPDGEGGLRARPIPAEIAKRLRGEQ